MTIQISLDGSALERLFPEGSQARIDLATSVVNNFVDKLGIKKLKELPADIREQLQRTAREAGVLAKNEVTNALIDGGLLTQKAWGIDLTEKGKAVIRQEVYSVISRQVSESLAEITSTMDMNTLIEQRIQSLVGTKVRETVADAVDAALRKKFAA